ncbi:hypothetical protein AB0I72_00390 [Nocardiopsis sp. NPDC049922]|uniref:hypothetical protein n=1 Tax=Nocardiopsis sp. NPDC049922 TaxID=3155157 RepID=UPI0034037F1E
MADQIANELTRQDALDLAFRRAGASAKSFPRLAAALHGEGSGMWVAGGQAWEALATGATWSVVCRSVAEVARDAEHAVGSTFRVLTDPTRITSEDDRDAHLATWAEFADLFLASLGYSDPAEVDAAITARMEEARTWLSVLGFLRADHVRRAFGTERGSQAAAARALGISGAAISGMLSADDERWAGWRYDADESAAGRPPRDPAEL